MSTSSVARALLWWVQIALKQIALREIYTCPECEDVSAVGIYPLTDEVVESNWSVQVEALTQATNLAAIYAQHKFRHEYNLLTG